MEGGPSGYTNNAMDEKEDYSTPKARNDLANQDADSLNDIVRRSIILNVSELPYDQGVDERDYELKRYPSLRRSTRSRRSSVTSHAKIDCRSEEDTGDSTEEKPDEETPVAEEPPFEDNIFSRRMTIAGGFLDVALFTSNCEQIKSILEIKEVHKHYELVLGLLIVSMILQGVCGFTLFMAGCVTIKHPRHKKRVDILNHVTIGIIVLITAVNIFISSFTVKGDVLHRCYSCLQETGY